jgi:hypothetical protein
LALQVTTACHDRDGIEQPGGSLAKGPDRVAIKLYLQEQVWAKLTHGLLTFAVCFWGLDFRGSPIRTNK